MGLQQLGLKALQLCQLNFSCKGAEVVEPARMWAFSEKRLSFRKGTEARLEGLAAEPSICAERHSSPASVLLPRKISESSWHSWKLLQTESSTQLVQDFKSCFNPFSKKNLRVALDSYIPAYTCKRYLPVHQRRKLNQGLKSLQLHYTALKIIILRIFLHVSSLELENLNVPRVESQIWTLLLSIFTAVSSWVTPF